MFEYFHFPASNDNYVKEDKNTRPVSWADISR